MPRGISFGCDECFGVGGDIFTFHFRGEYFVSAGNISFPRGIFFISGNIRFHEALSHDFHISWCADAVLNKWIISSVFCATVFVAEYNTRI